MAVTPEKQVVFSSAESVGVPVRGMASYPRRQTLGAGWFSLLQNVRYDRGPLQVRFGVESLGTVVGSSTFKGCWSAKVGGTDYAFAAYRVGSATRIYASPDLATWTEVTASGGGFGDTRIATNGPVAGCAFANRYSDAVDGTTPRGDALLAACAGETPKVAMRVAGAWRCRNHADPTNAWTPGYESGGAASNIALQARASLAAFLPMQGTLTVTNSDATGLLGAAGGSAPDQFFEVDAFSAGTTTDGDNSVVRFSASIDCSGAKQFILIEGYATEAAYSVWALACRVEIGDGASWMTLYDPEASGASYVRAQMDNQPGVASSTVWYATAYEIPGGSGASMLGAVDRIRFTWVAAAPAADTTRTLVAAGCSDSVLGSALYKVAVLDPDSLAESASVRLEQVGDRVTNLGAGGVYAWLRLPISTSIFYRYRFTLRHAQAGTEGAKRLTVYRKTASDYEYRWLAWPRGTWPSGAWDGAAWVFDTGNSGGNSGFPYSAYDDGRFDPTYPASRDIEAPDDLHLCAPKGGFAVQIGDRVYMGGAKPGELWISGFKRPHRWRREVRFYEAGLADPNSPVFIEFPGEKVQTVVSLSGKRVDDYGVYVFTDKGVWAFPDTTPEGLSRPLRVTTRGTLSPRSVVAHRERLYWVDQERRVRRMTSGEAPEDMGALVQDLLDEIPDARVPEIWGAAFKDRVYFAATPSGGASNTRVLVWDEPQQGWTVDALPATCAFQGLMFWESGGAAKLIGFGDDGAVYRHESAGRTQDLSTGSVAVAVGTPEYRSVKSPRIMARRFGVVCDDQPGGSASVAPATKPSGTWAAMTGSLDASGSLAYKWLQPAPGDPASPTGWSVAFDFTASMQGGTDVYEMVVETQPDHRGAE